MERWHWVSGPCPDCGRPRCYGRARARHAEGYYLGELGLEIEPHRSREAFACPGCDGHLPASSLVWDLVDTEQAEADMDAVLLAGFCSPGCAWAWVAREFAPRRPGGEIGAR